MVDALGTVDFYRATRLWVAFCIILCKWSNGPASWAYRSGADLRFIALSRTPAEAARPRIRV